MAARIFTSAGVNNLWSNAANWDGGLAAPADGDSVTIPVGQTCEYDYDMSAWVTGVAGLTITGTLSLTRTAGTYKLFIKAGTTINGAGTFDCGTAASPIPFAAKHLITGGDGWYITGASGMTMTVYDIEPTIKTVLLTNAEAIGATRLEIDTDVTGNIWTVGDTILIVNKTNSRSVETRTIYAITSTYIDITVGLTSAKNQGSRIVLATRNVQFFAGSYVWGNQLLRGFSSSKMIVAGGAFSGGYALINGSGTFSGGIFHSTENVASIFNASTNVTGTLFVNVTNFIYNSSRLTITGGKYYGIVTIVNYCSGVTLENAEIECCGYFASGASGSCSLINSSAKSTSYLGYESRDISLINVISDSGNIGLRCSFGQITNCNLAGIVNDGTFYSFNTLFSVNPSSIMGNLYDYSESVNHNQIAGNYWASSFGGITTTVSSPVPIGHASAFLLTLSYAIGIGYSQKEITVGAGASVNITSYLRKAASMAYLPRVIIFNKAATDPFAGGAGLHTFTMTNSIDTWESDVYTYTNSTDADVTLVIRTQGMAASGSVYSVVDVEQINVDMTTALAKLNLISGSIVEIKSKTDPITFTVTNQIDANVLSGGTSASMVWEYPVREITSGGTSASEIWNYISRTITSASGLGLASGSSVESITGTSASTIWEYENRTITSASAILNTLVEGAYTVEDVLKIMVAVLAGKSSGGGSTEITFRDLSDSLDRIVATVDVSGNRSSVILDL